MPAYGSESKKRKLYIMSKKALLIILDGYGIGDHKKDDVIFNTPTPYIDSLVDE